MNTITCDAYPSVLKDLTFVEESAIARRHPVGAVLKLRPGNCRNAASYYALRGHMIILPQNPGPLLAQLQPEISGQYQGFLGR